MKNSKGVNNNNNNNNNGNNNNDMNQRTRKLITLHKALFPRDNVDRQYASKKGGRGFTCIEDSVDASVQRLEDYIERCED